MAEHNVTGEKGEAMAREYLEKSGYDILETNWRWRKSELDIVARDAQWLVFAEVKTRKKGFPADPAEAMTLKKQRQLIIGANAFVEVSGIDLECRFDVITVVLSDKSAEIQHFRHAFYPFP